MTAGRGRYASETTVTAERSRAEIERTLTRYGATDFGYMVTEARAQVAFRIGTSTVRMALTLPAAGDFARTPANRVRNAAEQRAAREKAIMQRWRALALTVKAKLEAVDAGIATFEEEWFAYLVMPDGATVWENAGPTYRAAIASGRPAPLLAIEAH